MKDNNLEVAGVYFSRYEAEMAKGLLGEANILSVIRGDDAGGVWPVLAMGMGNFRLLVSREDFEAARDVLVSVSAEDVQLSLKRKRNFLIRALILFLIAMVLWGGLFGRNWLKPPRAYFFDYFEEELDNSLPLEREGGGDS